MLSLILRQRKEWSLMKRKLKVWALAFVDGTHIVAARNQKKAANAFGVSVHFLRGYGSVTENKSEIRIAESAVGIVWRQTVIREWVIVRNG